MNVCRPGRQTLRMVHLEHSPRHPGGAPQPPNFDVDPACHKIAMDQEAVLCLHWQSALPIVADPAADLCHPPLSPGRGGLEMFHVEHFLVSTVRETRPRAANSILGAEDALGWRMFHVEHSACRYDLSRSGGLLDVLIFDHWIVSLQP